MKLVFRTMCLAACVVIFSAMPATAALYSNGFETNTTDWNAMVTRVPSGTGGITSSSGGFHATAPQGSFTRWGGYNFGAGNNPTAFQEYTTTLDIYLDVDGPWSNDTRFAYTSAISNAAGTHLRDFVFSVGFYDDNIAPVHRRSICGQCQQ